MYVELATPSKVAGAPAAVLRVPSQFATAIPANATIASVTRIRVVRDEDNSYMELKPGFDRHALRLALNILDTFYLEPMDEDECPADVLPDGTQRVWLANI